MAGITRDVILRMRQEGAEQMRAALGDVAVGQQKLGQETEKSNTVVDKQGKIFGLARGELRQFRQEQRLQGFVLGQVRQGLTGVSVAALALSSSFGGTSKEAQRMTGAFQAGIGVMNAAEFAMLGFGLASGGVGLGTTATVGLGGALIR